MDIGTQVAAAAIISFVLNWLKKSSWFPWITAETTKLNRFMAILLSGLASVGIHFQWSSANHSLLITGLSLGTILLFLWHWFVQFVYTHGWFKATSASGEIAALLKQIIAAELKAAKQ
jgi:hypothetical protein